MGSIAKVGRLIFPHGTSSLSKPSLPEARARRIARLSVLFAILTLSLLSFLVRHSPHLLPLSPSASLSTITQLPSSAAPVVAPARASVGAPAAPVSYANDPPTKAAPPTHFCNIRPCVFDIGHNTGQDALFYLRDDAAHGANTRVVAVDANPQLMSRSAVRLAQYVSSGRLRLVTKGLVAEGHSRENNLTFFVNLPNDRFSSFSEELGCRDGSGRKQAPGVRTFCMPFSVAQATCADLVRQFGTPDYVKIDIEGRDLQCILSLATLPRASLPRYISVENVQESQLGHLAKMGYNGFKAVDQFDFDRVRDSELAGYSGPWGEEALDFQYGTKWISAAEMKARIPMPKVRVVDGVEKGTWHDLHARREM